MLSKKKKKRLPGELFSIDNLVYCLFLIIVWGSSGAKTNACSLNPHLPPQISLKINSCGQQKRLKLNVGEQHGNGVYRQIAQAVFWVLMWRVAPPSLAAAPHLDAPSHHNSNNEYAFYIQLKVFLMALRSRRFLCKWPLGWEHLQRGVQGGFGSGSSNISCEYKQRGTDKQTARERFMLMRVYSMRARWSANGCF